MGLVVRAVYVQVLGNAFFIKQGTVRFERQLDIPANRGRILDRNGLILASSVSTLIGVRWCRMPTCQSLKSCAGVILTQPLPKAAST